MVRNKVVCRYRDGRVLKGFTHNFFPGKRVFHLQFSEEGQEGVEVKVSHLKAVFFVKSLKGNKNYKEKKAFIAPPAGQKRVVIDFFDGERLVGTTSGYSHEREGFFIFPADPNTNTERVYVISSAVKKIFLGAKAEKALEEG